MMDSSVWAVTMVKDEADIIAYTLKHLAAEGVDGIIVADNLSTDGTRDILDSLQLRCELVVLDDPEVAYYQSEKMTNLAREAFAAGAEWVIPFDADELWCHPHMTLSDFMGSVNPSMTAVRARLFNHFPLPSEEPTPDPNPFKRITRRGVDPAPLPKVAIRRGGDFCIHQGNHGVTGRSQFAEGLEVRHFPWRTYEQFERKVENGYKAYLATDLPEESGGHWRSYGRVLEEGGREALRDLYTTWFANPPDIDLVDDPAPYRGS